MSTESLEARIIDLEKRAKIAEDELAKNKNKGAAGGAAADNNAEVLKRLNEIRAAVVQDQVEAQTAVTRKNELEEENGKLKEEISKLNYRIKFLLQSLEATDKK